MIMAKKRTQQKNNSKRARKHKNRQANLKKLSLSKQVTCQPHIEDRVDNALEIMEKGNWREAESMLAELKKEHGNHPHICFGRGVLAVFGGKHDEAISCFKKAIEGSPDFVEAHYNLAATYQKQLKIFEMITTYRHVILIGEDHSHVVQQAQDVLNSMEQQIRDSNGISLDEFLKAHRIFDRAVEHMESKEWEAAIADFRESLSINPNHPQTHGNLGLCYARMGKRQLALEAFDKALELDPRYKPAKDNRKLIASLTEDQCLEKEMATVNYYKDCFQKKKSGIKKLAEALGFRR
jgi:tetratricopeptide (TPR) repeat protein